MINKIFKYKLNPVESLQSIEMPEGAKILTVQTQYNEPCIWAMVDPSKPNTRRYIEVYMTGSNIPSADRRYIGTCQIYNDSYVIHLFELIQLTDAESRLLPEGARIIERTNEYITIDYPIWGTIKMHKFPEGSGL